MSEKVRPELDPQEVTRWGENVRKLEQIKTLLRPSENSAIAQGANTVLPPAGPGTATAVPQAGPASSARPGGVAARVNHVPRLVR